MGERKQCINYTVGLQFTENSILKIVTLTEHLLFTCTDKVYRRRRIQQFLSTADSQFPPNTHEVIRRGNTTCGGQRRFEQINSRSVKALWLQRPQKTAVLRKTKWWGPGLILCEPLQTSMLWLLTTLPAAAPAMNAAEGRRAFMCVAPVMSYHLILWSHHCTSTYFCHHHLRIMGWSGTAVLRTRNSTSSQSPQEGSGQEEVCQPAGQIGHVEANRGTSEKNQFTVSLCFFFCQSYWIHFLIWSSAWGFTKISKGTTWKGEELKFGIF